MSVQLKQNTAILASILVSTALLSACGVGPTDEGVKTDEPAMGQASEASTIAVPSQAQIPASTTQEPIPAQSVAPQPAANTSDSTSDTSGSVDSESAPLPEIVPEQSEPSEPATTPEPEVEPEPEAESAPESVPEPLAELQPEPVSVSCTTSTSKMQNSTLYLINQARSEARMCGSQSFAAAPPVAWNSKLEAAAKVHSTDMAQFNFFSHTGSDGSSSSIRATNQNYDWRTVGENIAAGQATSEAVVQDWIDSPGHCANLMNPSFEEVAVACIENNASQYRQYWTNVLGATF